MPNKLEQPRLLIRTCSGYSDTLSSGDVHAVRSLHGLLQRFIQALTRFLPRTRDWDLLGTACLPWRCFSHHQMRIDTSTQCRRLTLP